MDKKKYQKPQMQVVKLPHYSLLQGASQEQMAPPVNWSEDEDFE